jgi:hypothetical protein
MTKKTQRNNAAVQRSLRDGVRNGDYLGKPPRYAQHPGGARPVKVAVGVPFVHRNRLDNQEV